MGNVNGTLKKSLRFFWGKLHYNTALSKIQTHLKCYKKKQASQSFVIK